MDKTSYCTKYMPRKLYMEFLINTLGNLDHEGTWCRNLELHLIHPSGAYDFTFRATESSYTPWGANTAICTQNKDVKA